MAAPSAPVNVVLQTGNGQNLVSWQAVTGATSYLVQRSLDGVTWVALATVTTPSYLDPAVTVGIAYFYQVAASNGIPSAYITSYPPSITPCLPGQINLGYLRYQSQLRSDKLNSQYLTLDEWNINCNQSMFSLADILTTKFGDDYFLAPPLLLPLTGLDFYPLPDGSNYPVNGTNSPAIYKLLSVAANINGTTSGSNAGWVPLPRFNVSDLYKYTTFPGQAGALNNIYQMAYREIGQNLYVIPTNMNQVLKLLYVPIMKQMLQDTDMLAFGFSGWWEYIVNDVAMKAMVKEESLEKWNALAQANAQIILRIETTAANRDIGQPNSVSNVRNTMGDPGFSNWGNGWGGGGTFGSGGGY